MFPVLYYLIEKIQPILIPLCFVTAWTFLILLGWSLVNALRDAVVKSRQMHKIPCTHCQFFTNDHRLKCPVCPTIANTEQAIGCIDYHPLPRSFS